jgi:hypothetical protein
LIFLRQPSYVVLKRVFHPPILAAHIRDAPVSEPIIFIGKSFVQAIVEIFVVGKDDMSTNVKKLLTWSVRTTAAMEKRNSQSPQA